MELKTGDVLTLKTGGGAGYGPPAERPRALVREDVEQGFVSAESARACYDTEAEAPG